MGFVAYYLGLSHYEVALWGFVVFDDHRLCHSVINNSGYKTRYWVSVEWQQTKKCIQIVFSPLVNKHCLFKASSTKNIIIFFCLRSFYRRPRFLHSWDYTVQYFSLQYPLHTWMVTHLSANHGPSCLTSVILRELVFPTWYCRRLTN